MTEEFKGLRTFSYRCQDTDCGHVQDRLVRYPERHEPQTCEVCGCESLFTPSAPTVLTASWPDGHRKKNDPGWQLLRERSKLSIERAGTFKRSDKKDISNEIKKMTGK